jgi:exosortase
MLTGLRQAIGRQPFAAVLAIALAVCLTWVFWPTFCYLAEQWHLEAQYSHGYLVPFFALFLCWSRRDKYDAARRRTTWWGLAVLAAGLALRLGGTYVSFEWLRATALLPCLAGLILLVGGREALRWTWPGVVFLLFMIPLPYQISEALSEPLQRLGTRASTYFLQTLGFAAYHEGNVIFLDQVRVNIIKSCSGLSMLMIFIALSTAVVLVIPRSGLEKLLMLASAVPIALVANLVRITVTVIMFRTVGKELASLFFHNLAGWMMMFLALGMMWLELRLFSWILVSRPERTLASAMPFAPQQRAPAAPESTKHNGSHANTRMLVASSRPLPAR